MAQNRETLLADIIHGLRSAGWSRIDAEDEAMRRVERTKHRATASSLEGVK